MNPAVALGSRLSASVGAAFSSVPPLSRARSLETIGWVVRPRRGRQGAVRRRRCKSAVPQLPKCRNSPPLNVANSITRFRVFVKASPVQLFQNLRVADSDSDRYLSVEW